MDIKRFEEITNKIKRAENEKAKSEGAIESLFKQLKSDYGIETIEEAKEKVKQLNESIKKSSAIIEKMMDELENITDWDAI